MRGCAERRSSIAVATPDCPHCGCNATELVDAGTRYGKPWASYLCDHCHRTFSNGQQPAKSNGASYRVEFPKLQCPRCKSTRVETTSSPAEKSGYKYRYHSCNNCQFDFSSMERVEKN